MATLIDGDKIDGVGRGEQGGPVAGHSVGRAVLDQPAPGEGVAQLHRDAVAHGHRLFLRP
ncbi:MAG: hypothetical protein ACTIK1_07155 [Glutamicibacter arilaitensis]